MAFIYRDPILPSRMKWNSMSTIYQRFKKAWPTSVHTTTEGEALYTTRMYYYQGGSFQESISLKRFLNGMSVKWEEFISSPVDDEIDQVYFYLDPTYKWDGSYAGDTKIGSTDSTTQLVVPTRTEIAAMFNDNLEIDKEIRVNVEYGGTSKRYIKSHTLTWHINQAGVIESDALDTVAIRTDIESDPWYYLANARLPGYTLDNPQFQLYDGGQIDTPHHPNNPSNRLQSSCAVSTSYEGYVKQPGGPDAMYELGVFAAMGSNSFERIEESLDEEIATENTLGIDGEVLKYTYSYLYKFKGIDENDKLIDEILAYYNTRKPFSLKGRLALTPVGQYKQDLMTNTKDTIYKRVLNEMLVYLDIPTGTSTQEVSNSLFFNGQLRVKEAGLMRRSDFVTMIATSMETDYTVEEAEWWEKVLAVVIVILAIVAFIYTLGSSATLTPLLLSQAAGYSAAVLTVGAYALSMFGGLSAGVLVDIIGQFAQIVGIIALVAGVYAAIDAAGRVAVEQGLKAAGKEVTSEAVKAEMLNRALLDNVSSYLEQSINTATSKVSEFMTMGMDEMVSTITDGLDFVMEGLSHYQDQEQKALQKELAELTAEQEQFETEYLNNQLKSPAEVWEMTEDRITSYDALTELNLKLEALARGGNPSYDIFDSHVNSV